LLAGDAEPPRALAAAGVRLRPLAPDRQAAPVEQAAVGADLHQPFDVLRALAAQVALDLPLLDRLAQLDDLLLGQILDLHVGVDPGLAEDLPGSGATDPEDVGERDFDPFPVGDVDAGDSCHG